MDELPTKELFAAIHTKFYETDYTLEPIIEPNYRDRFHFEDVGMGAFSDKYAIVVIDRENQFSRVIVMDYRKGTFIVDAKIPFGIIDSVGKEYIAWGETVLASNK